MNDGKPTPAAAVPGAWGVTLGGVPAVWRTGLGISVVNDATVDGSSEVCGSEPGSIVVEVDGGAVTVVEDSASLRILGG